MLREYIYLDRNRVEDFLSQLEGGVSDTVRATESEAGTTLDGGVNVGFAKVGASLSTPGFTQEDLRKTTDVALFERLWQHLDRDGLKCYDDRDEIKFNLLKRGDLIELDGDMVVSGMSKLFRTLGEMQVLAPVTGESIDGVDEIRAVFGDDLPVRFLLDGEIIAHSTLSIDSLRGDAGDIDGECTALVRVRKTVKRGKRVPLRKFAGIELSVEQTEELVDSFELGDAPKELGVETSMADFIAEGPCALVTTVAIYR